MGFYCFTSAPAQTEISMKLKVAALTNVQKNGVIEGFAKDTPVGIIQHRFTIPVEIVSYLYDKIDEIQKYCKSNLRGEVVVTPAVLDVDGNVVTPAVMNTPAATQVALETIVDTEFKTDLGSWIITQIMNAIYAYSKYDGKGDYTFYKSQIIL